MHHAAMECFRRAMLPNQPADFASKLRKDGANLARGMTDMLEALDRKRGKGPQVVRVELSGAAFEAGSTALLAGWNAQIEALPASLKARPSIVRIAYGAGVDPPDLVRKRTEAVRKLIAQAWKQSKGQYTLVVEIEGQL